MDPLSDPAGSTEDLTEALAVVRDVFAGLEKALKVRRLYEAGHKLRDAAIEELAARFDRALETLGEISVDVGPETLAFEGEVVFREGHRDGSVTFKLFRDGIRALTFSPGLESGEIGRFLGVLETPVDVPGHFDEDMATLLWHEAFEFIAHVAIDEISGEMGGEGDGDGDAPGLGSGAGGGAAGGLGRTVQDIVNRITSTETPGDGEAVRAVAERGEVFEMERRRLPSSGDTADASIDVPEESLERLRALADEEDVGALVHRVVGILFDLFREDECTLELEDVRSLLTQFLLVCLDGGNLPALNAILDRFLRRRRPDRQGPVDTLIDGLLEDLSSEDAMRRLRSTVESGFEGGPDVLLRLMLRLKPEALALAARHVRLLPEGPACDVYHRVLRSRGRENPEALLLYLEDGRAEEVIETLETFLETADASSIAHVLLRLLEHDDPRVRIEALRRTSYLEPEDRPGLLRRALTDGSRQVRMTAVRVAESEGDSGIQSLLISLLAGERLDPDERLRVIHAVAMLGGLPAAECLRQHLAPRRLSFLRGKKAQAELRGAVLCLRDVRDEAVRQFLEEGAKSRDGTLADACRSALALARAAEGRES